ncbi:hypothetical protein BHQ15_07230 [Mycolicibacillus koreensis]|nr:hypothetical protein BHQ15_07230 [Mycolicibacillus koreensis]
MPRSLDLSADYPAAVERVFAAFADEGYWRARLADSGADIATLNSIGVATDGTITVTTTQSLHRQRLPALAAQFLHGNLEVVRHELWYPVRDGASDGEVSAEVTSAPASLSSTARLAPRDGGSRLTVAAAVRVNVPLVGGKIEGVIAGALSELMAAEQRFTTAWLTGEARG